MAGKDSSGCIENYLFLWDYNTKDCFLLDLTSLSRIALPLVPINPGTFGSMSVSSSLSSHDCVVIFTSVNFRNLEANMRATENFIIFCHLNGGKKWTKIPVTLPDDDCFAGTNIVHKGKLYAQISSGVVIVDVSSLIHGGNVEMRIIKGPEVPKYPRKDTQHLNLVESKGEIFMVRVYLRNRMVVYVDIQRLDNISVNTDNNWKRVESIGDRAFLLEEKGGITVCAKDVGVQSNCIYSLRPSFGGSLCKFCLDDRTFTFNIVVEEAPACPNTFCWIILPSRHEKIRGLNLVLELPNLVLNKKLTQNLEVDVNLPWADLPRDIFQSLLPCLSVVDIVRLLAVCKAWKSIPKPFAKVETWPWLMYNENVDGTYKFLDPLNGKQYTTKIERLSLGDQNDRILLLCSKNGWIMALIDDRTVVMVNPFFPNNAISAPPLPNLYSLAGISFSSVPNHPDCVVFGISSSCNCSCRGNFVEIFLWRPMSEKWDKLTFSTTEFVAECTNPVFINGDFYCLGKWGILGVFNLETKTWKVMCETERVISSMYEECNLLEYQGELICTFQRMDAKRAGIRTFKWDQNKMTWDQMLNGFEGLTLFLDSKSCHAKALHHCNKGSFSPAFDPLDLFSEIEANSSESYDLKRPIDCVWLEPNICN